MPSAAVRIIRTAILFVLGFGLVILALANREPVTLRLLPDSFPFIPAANVSLVVPLFVAIFGGAAVGIVIGFAWEWTREHGQRSAFLRRRKEDERRGHDGQGEVADDDIIALLD